MTEAEKKEYWRSQTLIKMDDMIKTKQGYLVKPEAMARIAETCEFSIIKGRIYRLTEAFDLIIQSEVRKKQRQAEFVNSSHVELSKTEQIVDYLASLPETKKKDNFFIVKEIDKYYKAKPVEVKEAIELAAKRNVNIDAESLMTEYTNNIRLRAVAINIKNWKEKYDEKELVEVVSKFLFNNYLMNVSYGQLRFVLEESSLSDTTKKAVVDRYYELMVPILTKKYRNTKLVGSELAQDIIQNYGSFDMNRIFGILKENCPDLDLNVVMHQAYKIEDEGFIKGILLEANRKRTSAAEIVQSLLDFQSEYPMEFIVETVKGFEKNGFVLPYSQIYEGLKQLDKEVEKDFSKDHLNLPINPTQEGKLVVSVPKVKTHEEEENEPFGLQPVEKESIVLTDDGKFEQLDQVRNPEMQREKSAAEEDFDNMFGYYRNKRRHRITKREKAIKMVDRKMVVSRLIVASGVISTAALTVLYGVNPVVAARNCAASISSFASSNLALNQILPASKDFISVLATVGTTIAGTISWLRNRKKKAYLEDAKLQEQTSGDAIEDMFEAFSESRGGRTR